MDSSEVSSGTEMEGSTEVDPAGMSDRKATELGKSNRELSPGGKRRVEASKAQYRQEDAARAAKAKQFMADHVQGSALFFCPAPEQLEEFAEWLT